MNNHSIVKKLDEAEQILALMKGLACNAQSFKPQLINGLARLKSVITDAELLLGVQLKEAIVPPLQQAAVMRGHRPEPLPDKGYCSECGMPVNSSYEQHYHWCSLAGNGA